MAKTSKTYRGQGRNKDRDHIGCGCFLCVGHDRGNQYVQREKEDLKEVNEIINNVCLHNVISGLGDDLNKQLDDLILEGLKRKGYEIPNRHELESFIKERCKCEDRPHLQERTYFVDEVPFFLHRYNNEYSTDLVSGNFGETSISITGGSFAYL